MGHTVLPKLGISGQQTPSAQGVALRPGGVSLPGHHHDSLRRRRRRRTGRRHHPLHSSFVTFAWQNFSIPASEIGGLGCRRRLGACDVPCVLTLDVPSRIVSEQKPRGTDLSSSRTTGFGDVAVQANWWTVFVGTTKRVQLPTCRDERWYSISVVDWYSQS